jgi:hypothetical protein
MGDGRPTWAWCIATYKRHDMLERSCALALEQTVPPSELVVTDASPNWDEGRARLEKVLASYAATGRAAPRLDYAEASVASSSKQRNESIERCTADVLFLFDDDTLMFPETAERLLEVYARRRRRRRPGGHGQARSPSTAAPALAQRRLGIAGGG